MLFNKDSWGKVDMTNSVTYLNQTVIFEWYKDRYASRMDTKETPARRRLNYMLKKMITILGLIVNIIGKTYMII